LFINKRAVTDRKKNKKKAGFFARVCVAGFQGKMDCEALVYKRGKARNDGKGEAVSITLQSLEELGSLPLARAASTFGLSATAFKGACRKLGIKRWPYFQGRGLLRELLKPPAASAPAARQDAATQTDVCFGGVYGCELPALVDTDPEFDGVEEVVAVWKD
jgi:hypothetical protein